MSFLTKAFASAAAAAGLAAALSVTPAAQARGDLPVSPFPDGGSCIMVPEMFARLTPDQQRLAALYDGASESPTGAAVMTRMQRGDPLRICFNNELNQRDSCGYVLLGRYMSGNNKMEINPHSEFPDHARVSVLIHESRHKIQKDAGLDKRKTGNIPEQHRVAVLMFGEADARLAAMLHAWEMKDKGRPEYLDFMRASDDLRLPLAAFEDSLAARPDDMKAAMQAAMRAVLYDLTELRYSYAMGMIADINADMMYFDSSKPADNILDETALYRLGDMGAYGNYMDEDMINTIRASLTAQQYETLAAAYANPSPSAPACK